MPQDSTFALSFPGLLFAVAASVLFLILKRRDALLPLIVTTCYMTLGQKLVIAGLHFTVLRMLVLAGCLRIVIRGETNDFRWCRLDTLITCWAAAAIVTYTILWQSADALINRLGVAYDAFGLYFIFRFLLRDMEDLKRCARRFAWLLLPLALCMSVEKMTGANPFYVFGGVPRLTEIREGVLRCQGPFLHPILAGTFGAVWLPMFAALWQQGRRYQYSAGIGIVASGAITFLSGSSGPVATFLAGMLALLLWPLRRHMRSVRWTIVASLVAIQLVMKAPI